MSDDPTALDLLTVAPARADLKVDFESAIDQLPPGEPGDVVPVVRIEGRGIL